VVADLMAAVVEVGACMEVEVGGLVSMAEAEALAAASWHPRNVLRRSSIGLTLYQHFDRHLALLLQHPQRLCSLGLQLDSKGLGLREPEVDRVRANM